MSNKTIAFDEVNSVIAKINLSPKLDELLYEFSQWCSYQAEDWEEDFCDYMSGTQVATLYEFLNQNNIGIRPSGFEYFIKEDLGNAEESQQND